MANLPTDTSEGGKEALQSKNTTQFQESVALLNPKMDAGDQIMPAAEGHKLQAEKPKTFDDILIQLGEFGRYQRNVYFLLFLPTIFSAMHKMAWVFLGARVNHRCRLPFEANEAEGTTASTINMELKYQSDSNLSTYYKWDTQNDRFEQCSRLDEQQNEIPCDHGWVYDRTMFGSSAVMEWNLVSK